MAHTVSTGAGRVLEGAVGVLGRARSVDKPMHPLGTVHAGRLTRTGGPERTGAAFLDEPGEDDVLVRLSRSAGLPEPWPDVNGLAVRVARPDGGFGDLLLSGTGRGTLTRWSLAGSRTARGGFFGSLVPFRTPTGAVLVGAEAAGDGFDLRWARPRGSWHPFASLALDDAPGSDFSLSFDAILHVPDGLEHYDWYARLRAPSYAVARRLRGVGPSSD